MTRPLARQLPMAKEQWFCQSARIIQNARRKEKRKGWMGLSRRSMVLDAMMGIWLLKGLEILKFTGTGHSNSMQAKCDWQTIVSANGSRSNSYTTSPPCQLHCYTTCDQCCKKMGKWRSAKSKCAQKKTCCLAGTNSQAYAVDVDGKDSSHCLQQSLMYTTQ